MAKRFFTTYWRPDGWAHLPEGSPVRYAGAANFIERGVAPGDRLYVVNTRDGQMRLLTAFDVSEVLTKAEARARLAPDWDAEQYAVADENTSAPLSLRPVPTDITRHLRFVSQEGLVPLKFDDSDLLDRQTLRGVRELDATSAALLETFLDAPGTAGRAGTETILLPMFDDDGRTVKSSFRLLKHTQGWHLILESRGGTIGTPSERNPEYSIGLRLLLRRLASASVTIEDARVESATVIDRGLSEDERRIRGLDFPLRLSPGLDANETAARLQRGQVEVGAEPGTMGGNSTRRILLHVTGADVTDDDLVKLLTVGQRGPDALVPLGPVATADMDDDFDPTNLQDARQRVLAALAQQQGQPKFRRALLNAYESRCAITGCDLLDALEAAHIVPYWGPKTNHVQNGILLRADLHTLFDRGLIGIEPATWQVRISSRLQGTHYESLERATMRVPKSERLRPNAEALAKHLQSVGLGARVVARV